MITFFNDFCSFFFFLEMNPLIIGKKRGTWSQADMTMALHAVKEGELSTNSAAKRYGVPRRTLRRYINQNKDIKSKLGRKAVLNADQENYLCNRIFRLADVGYPLTSKIIRLCVFRFCKENKIPNNFSMKKQIAGRY